MGKQLWIPSKALTSDYSFINSYDQYKKLFQTRMAPENEIIRVQRDALEYLKINTEIQAEFDALNIDINEKVSYDNLLKEKIDKIFKEVRGSLLQFNQKIDEWKQLSPEKYKSNLLDLLNQWENIANTYEGENAGTVAASIKRLRSNIELVRSALNNDIDVSDIKTVQIVYEKDGKKKTSKGGASIAKSLQGISSAIAGVVLEKALAQYFQDKIPRITNTGDIKVSKSNGSVVDIKEDLANFIESNVEIEMADKSRKSIKDIIAMSNNNQSVILSEVGYEELQQQMKFGISAKAGASKSYSLHKGLSLNQIVDWSHSQSLGHDETEYTWMIHHIWQLARGFEGETHKFDDTNIQKGKAWQANFNYVMSKSIHKIIGNKNKIFATSSGYETTYSYVSRLLDHQKRIRATGMTAYTGASVSMPNLE